MLCYTTVVVEDDVVGHVPVAVCPLDHLLLWSENHQTKERGMPYHNRGDRLGSKKCLSSNDDAARADNYLLVVCPLPAKLRAYLLLCHWTRDIQCVICDGGNGDMVSYNIK